MRRPAALVGMFAAFLAIAPAAPAAEPPVRHVFMIVMENQDYDTTFGGQTAAPYLASRLPARGALVPDYYGVTHFSLGNYIALVSGQGANPQTQADCQVFTPMLPGTIGADGQARGSGCVYPSRVRTVADQLTARGLRWKGYMQGMGTPCRHPAIGSPDPTQHARLGDQYAARHNPFVYFRSLLRSGACARNDVPLTRLPADLRHARRTPSLAFITPDLCNDGHDAPCVDGRPGGLISADRFLRRWVPRITHSPAFRRDGALIVTFDEAEASSGACCGEPQFPNTADNGFAIPGRGGGRTGAVVLSRYVNPGTVSSRSYNHFSLLRTIEDLFGLHHLGYAGQKGLRAFGADVFTCPKARRLRPRHGRYRRGALIRSVTVSRGTARHPTLEVRLRRGARISVAVTRHHRLRRVGRAHTARPCRPVRSHLPRAHGRAVVRARAHGGTEPRRRRF